MAVVQVVKPRFAVIGMEGSTDEEEGFLQRLWSEANARFPEIAHLCARGEDGSFAGFWGAMTDFTRSFRPWEDFERRGDHSPGGGEAAVRCGGHPPDALGDHDIQRL